MKEKIQNLRTKPEATRRNILHGVIFLFAIVLILLWVFTLNRNIKDETVREGIANDVEAFVPLTDDLIESYSQVGNSGLTIE